MTSAQFKKLISENGILIKKKASELGITVEEYLPKIILEMLIEMESFTSKCQCRVSKSEELVKKHYRMEQLYLKRIEELHVIIKKNAPEIYRQEKMKNELKMLKRTLKEVAS